MEEKTDKLNEEQKKEELEKMKKAFGWIPTEKIKDPYRNNILYLLNRFDGSFDNEGRLCFKQNVLMEKFGQQDIQSNSFLHTQSQKVDYINRNGEYPGWILSIGNDGLDQEGDRIFFYRRTRRDLPVPTQVKSFRDEDELLFGGTAIKPDSLKGAEVE